MSTEVFLIIVCSTVVLSYLFSIISKKLRLPSVLLLLAVGIVLRYIADQNNVFYAIPQIAVEGLGLIGLIMIVLEAGLDLKIEKKNYPLIRSAFSSAAIILLFSSTIITFLLRWWLNEAWISCIIYAIPLSIVSSAIVIPSLHHLTPLKKDFLVYEASFSDILGILLFNYFAAGEILSLSGIGFFAGGLIISIVLSVVFSIVLFLLMANTKLNIRFFLVFSLLILLYATGKILHLPSLLIIMIFGLMINNWTGLPVPKFLKNYPQHQVDEIHELLHAITAETSFLIRTFFFILFGFTIQIQLIFEYEVVLIGSLILVALLLVRVLYLQFFLRENLFPEIFFMPRGLITIVLFYKIPTPLKLSSFNESIIAFVILSTSLLMAMGSIFYRSSKPLKEEYLFEGPVVGESVKEERH